MNHPIMFLDRDNKTKLVTTPFSYNFYERKITVTISHLYKETN